MIDLKTKSGFEISLDEDTMNNMELLDALTALQEGDGTQMSHIIPMVLGKDGKKRLYDHLRLPNGRVPTNAVDDELSEIMQALNSGKNSSSSPN